MSSVKQENRWRRTLKEMNDDAARKKLAVESLSIARVPPVPVSTNAPTATRRQVRAWMRRAVAEEGYNDATHLAEAANDEFHLPEGAMDDETHWVWEEAIDAVGSE